jgi:Flp pilus assembly protein CpaB
MKNLQPKKSSRLFILIGVVLTVLSMIGVFAISNGSSKTAQPVGNTPVLVASKLIPRHTVFANATDVSLWMTTVMLPANVLPPQYFPSVTNFVKQELGHGKITTSQNILPNEEVVGTQFIGLGSRPGVTPAVTMTKDDVAISMSASIENESGGAITPGDYVDIVASFMPGGSDNVPSSAKAQTGFVLQNIQVIAVGPFVPGSTENSVAQSGQTMLTFAVTRPNALIIQHLKDFSSSWDVSILLRSAYSSKTYTETPVQGMQFFTSLTNNFIR